MAQRASCSPAFVLALVTCFAVIMASMQPDLMFLLEEKGVTEQDVEKLKAMGITSMSRMSLLEDTRAGARQAIGKVLELDADTPDGRGRLIAVLDAWESAQKRVEVQRAQDAEAKMNRLPRTLTKSSYLALRRSAQEVYGEITDKVAPGAALVEMVLEQVEEHALEAIPFTQVFCVEDGEDLKTGAVIDTAGVVRIRRGRCEVTMPSDTEALRKKLRCWGFAFAYAKLRHPGRAWLKSVSVEVISEYCDYLLGEHVRGLEAKDQHDSVVARPIWALVLSYEFQIRKEMAKLILEGADFARALREAWTDPVLKERYFITPLAVSAVSSAPRARSRSPRGKWAPAPNEKGAGKGGQKGRKNRGAGKGANKGGQKGHNKGAGKGGAKDWHSSTPDGRSICYAYNNVGENCQGKCNRVHVCRRCFGQHPVHQCSKAPGSAPAGQAH